MFIPQFPAGMSPILVHVVSYYANYYGIVEGELYPSSFVINSSKNIQKQSSKMTSSRHIRVCSFSKTALGQSTTNNYKEFAYGNKQSKSCSV
jgi:hypothetical protein